MRKTLLRLCLALVLAGCAGLPESLNELLSTPTPGAATGLPTAPELSPTPEATLTSTPEVEGPPETPGPVALRIWVPPQFDPQGGTPAGDLLQDRLDEFSQRRSGVSLEVRVKAAFGPGGLLDTLTTASAAAPLALPDLILLPRPELETAALKGLLSPLTGLTASLEEDDWYPYARQLAHLQDTAFGLPFCGDAFVLLYRPASVEAPPTDWESTLALNQPLVFPAADEQALHTLTQYLATRAGIQDGEGRPALDPEALGQVLTFFQNAEVAGVMPFWITQYSTDGQAWQAYNENRAHLLMTWISRYLGQLPGDTAAAPIPTPDGEPFTLASGWVWALPAQKSEHHPLGVELAEFLTSADFLAEWTALAGYLPPRASALAGWPNPTLQGLVEQVVRSAQLIPPADVLTVLSPALNQATLEVLKEQANPAAAAQEASELQENP
jgi:ABC-type glycerol-3-phosphate transport system substrate-binding protein